MTARRVIDGAILDGKITFWTVNFTKSQKQPHTDNTGNEWDLSLAGCLAAAGSSGAAERAQYRRPREGLKAAFVCLLLYCNMCDKLLRHNQGNPVHPSLPPSHRPVQHTCFSQYTCTCSPGCLSLTSNFPALFRTDPLLPGSDQPVSPPAPVNRFISGLT